MSSQENCSHFDVVIIGAGLSGLTAAYYLLKKKSNLKICILEAKDRVGGRLLTKELKSVNGTDKWDMGGAWVGKNQTFIMNLLKELEIEIYPQYFDGKKMLQVGDNYQISEYSGNLPSMGFFSLFDVGLLMRKYQKVEKIVPIWDPGSCSKANQLDSQTTESFIMQRSWSKTSIDTIRAAWRSIFGAEMSRTSALYSMAYTNAARGIDEMVTSNEHSSQGYKIKGGAQQICEKLVDILGKSILKLNTAVIALHHCQESVKLCTNTGEEITSKYVVTAIPPHLIANIAFTPPLKPRKREFLLSVVPGHLIKFYLTYKTSFWRDLGYSGEIVTNGGPSFTPGCSTGPLCITYDGTSADGSPALVGFIGGEQALEYETKMFEERREAVLRSLETFFPSAKIRDYISYNEKNWREEPYNGGCPVTFVPPGTARLMYDGLREPHGRILFASTEAALQDIGFMSGAVESGLRAVKQIEQQLGLFESTTSYPGSNVQ